MYQHYKIVCIDCGTVIEQCRCSGPNKKGTYGICKKCIEKVILAPCPFCGKPGKHSISSRHAKCGNPECSLGSKKDVWFTLDAWNHRPVEMAISDNSAMVDMEKDKRIHELEKSLGSERLTK